MQRKSAPSGQACSEHHYGANSIVASVANVMRHVFHCTSALLQAFDASQESAMAILFLLTVAMTVLELCCGMRTETLW